MALKARYRVPARRRSRGASAVRAKPSPLRSSVLETAAARRNTSMKAIADTSSLKPGPIIVSSIRGGRASLGYSATETETAAIGVVTPSAIFHAVVPYRVGAFKWRVTMIRTLGQSSIMVCRRRASPSAS